MAAFSLKVNSTDTDLLESLRRVEAMESLDALDTVVLEMEITGNLSLQDMLERLRPGMPYSVTAGGRTLTGDLVRVSARVGPRRSVRVVAVGLELMHRLRNQRVSTLLKQTKDKVAAQIIRAATATAKATAVTATAGEELLLDDPALITLKQLADERNYALRAEGKTLNFAPRGVAAGKGATLSWDSEVREAELSQDISELVTSVKVTGLDYRKPTQDIAYDSKAPTDLRKIAKGDIGVALRKKAMGELAVVRALSTVCMTTSDAKERAKAELQRRAETFLKATYRSVGRADIHPGQSLTVEDAPWPFGGPFLVRATHHVVFPPQLAESRVEVFSDALPKS